jgi:hypothetical protein
MGSRKGIKNKRTILREANMREAAARAQLDLAACGDEAIKADSLAAMEEAMTFFLRSARKEKDRKAKGDYFLAAAGVAERIAPYRYPKLSSVRVSADRSNVPHFPDGVTTQEIRAELFEEIRRSGLLPTQLKQFLPEPETRSVQSLGSHPYKSAE